MPKRTTAPAGAPCWVDLSSSDTDRTRAFYGELFGWEAQDPNPDFGGYFNFTKHGEHVAGCMSAMPDAPVTDVWAVYLTTDDAEKTVDAARAAGSDVIVPAMPVGDLGSMGLVTDPGGAAIGLWQPGEHKGFGLVTEDGVPSWFELHTRDYEDSVSFYRNVFRWTTNAVGDTPEFRYTVLAEGDEQYAGIMDASAFLPDGVPAHWSVYFGCDDADATLAKIVELGGQVVVPAEDTPYGRLATASDVNGAVFKLVAPNEAMPAKG